MRYLIVIILLVSAGTAFAVDPQGVQWEKEIPYTVAFSQASKLQPGSGKSLIESGKTQATELLGKTEREIIEFLGEPDIVSKIVSTSKASEVRWTKEVPSSIALSRPSQEQSGTEKNLIGGNQIKMTEPAGKTEGSEFTARPDMIKTTQASKTGKNQEASASNTYSLSYFLKKYKDFKNAVLELTFNKDGEVVTYSVRSVSEIDLLKSKKMIRN